MKNLFTITALILCSFIFAENSILNLNVKGMHCNGCANKVKSSLTEIKGVQSVDDVSFEKNSASITYDAGQISSEKIVEQLALKTGYTISAVTSEKKTTEVIGTPKACCKSGTTTPACTNKKENSKK